MKEEDDIFVNNWEPFDPPIPQESSTAIFSRCGKYRYSLIRRLGTGKHIVFIMLNPSVADSSQDDPTIRRCIGFAKLFGAGTLQVVNLFALVSTDPGELKRAVDPVGLENNDYLLKSLEDADIFICAWGTLGALRGRDKEVLDFFMPWPRELHCLKKSKDGHPCHPLYLKADLRPILF